MRKVELTEKEAALVGRIVESELRDQISERRRAKEKITIMRHNKPVVVCDEAALAEYEYADNVVKTLYQIKAKLEREEE